MGKLAAQDLHENKTHCIKNNKEKKGSTDSVFPLTKSIWCLPKARKNEDMMEWENELWDDWQ